MARATAAQRRRLAPVEVGHGVARDGQRVGVVWRRQRSLHGSGQLDGQTLAVLGTLYRPGRYGPGGEILAAPEPLPGYHANLRWLDGQPPAELLALAVYPATPSVVWA